MSKNQKQDEWRTMNPPIEQLQAGDWVQIANGDWYSDEITHMNSTWIVIGALVIDIDLITDTHRGDKPPVTDRERLDWLDDERNIYESSRIIAVTDIGKLRQAIDEAMQEEGE